MLCSSNKHDTPTIISDEINEFVAHSQNDDASHHDIAILREELLDIAEFALEGIIDASDSPTIPVVDLTMKWLQDIKNGRSRTGALLKRVDIIRKSIENEAKYKNSDAYLAKQIMVHEKFLKFCSKLKFTK